MSLIARDTPRGTLRAPTHPESLFGALSEVIAAGQQLVLDRIAMLQAEVTSDVQKTVVGGGVIAGAGVVTLLGYIVLTVALVALLHRWLPLDAALAIVGGFNLVVGGVGIKVGMNRLSMPSMFDRPVAAEKES